MGNNINIVVEFLGGLDSIFDNKRSYKVEVDNEEIVTLRDLIFKYIAKELLVKPEDNYSIYIQDDTIRPGILTLINDVDWELEDELDYVLQNRDVISFTSTLHGG
ncbi:ubiquitin related modifier 1 [Hanseniaspora valbyensis NRRL Y-1626]|uniref:Ubiquitin-related modifier 1 n=1 Tax=Hanseniaspora valbyensis NRRL Y-1626 TaxID=766949 RepID=A0A1B7THZ0_9ASCO|nr:ubiquitin related modifier 1 [Hanseniaspora valbyensis NRRL Y-1626]